MVRKFLILMSFMVVCIQANANCVVNFSAQPNVIKVEKSGAGLAFKNMTVICEKLKRANAKLNIKGQSNVLSNVSIGSAHVSVMDEKLDISTNNGGGVSTSTNDYASQNTADDLMMASINQAIEAIDFDKALNDLEIARQKVKAFYKK